MFTQHLHLALFDIKIKSHHKNLYLIKGNEYDVENLLFEGSVKLSLKEDIHIKKIKLGLVGEFYYEYSSKETHDQYLDRLCVLKIDWNNLLTDDEGNVAFGNYGDGTIPMYKMKKGSSSDKSSGNNSGTTTPRPSYGRTTSSPMLNSFGGKDVSKIIQIPKSGIDGTPFKELKDVPGHSFLLPKGNYSLPFKVYLPANVGETVEGLPIGTLLYKMQCTIERGRFEKSHQTSKHIRIVRTLHPRNMNLLDSIDVDNTWVGKLQYLVSMPKKAVAIGSTVPIHVTIIPIAKGLSLKAMNACIVEHYHIQVDNQRSPEYERLCGKQELTIPSNSDLEYDRWVIKTHYKVPDHLRQISQTCDVKNSMIVIKHRLRVAIQLKNKEGHTSELRANLPVCVYLSANIGHVVGRHYDIDNHHGTFVLDYKKEDVLFHKRDSAPATPAVSDDEYEGESEEETDNDLDREESAPPLYEKHVFDKIFDMNLPQTPLEQLRSQTGSPIGSANNSTTNLDGYFDMPIQKAFDLNKKKKNKSVDFSHIPSYNEAIDDDDDDDSYVQDGFAPSYSDGSGSEKSRSGSSTPNRIMSNSRHNRSTGHLKIPLGSSSASHSRSSSGIKLDKMGSEFGSPKLTNKLFKRREK
ncbi:hypothetical protein I9W82_001097 [Candida metapsilosis]|uniref:Arrestin C-terminal-like domain-containing protein n=1 Tax=Candida metapsilosis TaxID=273372 RepID=A0A8H7ZJN0_9ASCO|nr:hypothetical protein I9W82_001097 [Candida metapsilosis]